MGRSFFKGLAVAVVISFAIYFVVAVVAVFVL